MADAIEATAPESAKKSEPMPVERGDILAAIALGTTFLVTAILSLLFAVPFRDAGVTAFEDPEAVSNILYYVAALFAFTAFILYAAKKKWLKVIQMIILTAVASTMVYLVPPLALLVGISSGVAWILGLLVGIACAIGLYKYPEWWVLDIVGVLVAAAAATIFGISLSVPLTIGLLVILAIYDAIAVYRTRHMLTLADSVMELRLPVLLVIPKVVGYSFLKQKAAFKDATPENKAERDAIFMGLGDLVMPTILLVSGAMFIGGLPILFGTMIGILVGYATLMTFVMKGNPQAGLPLLNGGAIVGFLIGLYIQTGSVQFW